MSAQPPTHPYPEDYGQHLRDPCTMGVGCVETGACYAAANGEPDRCPKSATGAGWAWLDAYSEQRHGEAPADISFSADEMIDAFIAGRMQGLLSRAAKARGEQ